MALGELGFVVAKFFAEGVGVQVVVGAGAVVDIEPVSLITGSVERGVTNLVLAEAEWGWNGVVGQFVEMGTHHHDALVGDWGSHPYSVS